MRAYICYARKLEVTNSLNGLHGFANGDPIRNIEDNHEVCNALDEAWERWIHEQDWNLSLKTIYARM